MPAIDDFEKVIKEWVEYHGNKKYHIDGGGTQYPGTPQERKIPMKIVEGPLKPPWCKICGTDMEKIRKEDSKRRVLRFCSVECYNEAKELHKIWKKIGAEILWWPPSKPPVDKRKLTYTLTVENGIRHKYDGRKPRSQKETNNISRSILQIARDVLPPTKFEEAMNLVQVSLDENNEERVAQHLYDLLHYQTPDSSINAKHLDYAKDDLEKLGSKTRSLCWEASQSLELVCHAILDEKSNFVLNLTLGDTIRKLRPRKILDSKTIETLTLINKHVFNKAKHEVQMNYDGRPHLFSVQETILVWYSVVALTRKLIQYIKFDYDWICRDWDWLSMSDLRRRLQI